MLRRPIELAKHKFFEVMSRLRIKQNGLSEKNRSTLQQFDDARTVSRVLTCPDDLWDVAKKVSGKNAQLLAQSAVLIEILIHAPLRISNLRTLRLDQHLSWVGGQIYINIPRDESKNTEALHYILPPRATRRVDEYIENWRCLFLPESNPYLFPGRNSWPKDESSLRRQIVRHLFNQTGVRMTPHQFRHFVSKLILDSHPGYYELVRNLLGHKSHSAAYENYSGTEQKSAFAFYDKTVLDRRSGRPVDFNPAGTNNPAVLSFMNPYSAAADRSGGRVR